MRQLLLCPAGLLRDRIQINPWMSRARARIRRWSSAMERTLQPTLQLDCKSSLSTQAETARHGFHRQRRSHRGRRFIPSNFRHEERAGEAPHFARWMDEHGYEVVWLPKDLYFEGEGVRALRWRRAFLRLQISFRHHSHRAVARHPRLPCDSVGWSIRAFITSTPAFVRCGWWARSGFPRRLMIYGQRAIRDHLRD